MSPITKTRRFVLEVSVTDETPDAKAAAQEFFDSFMEQVSEMPPWLYSINDCDPDDAWTTEFYRARAEAVSR